MDLTGIQKAAAFLIELDPKTASVLLRNLDDSDVVKLGKEMVELGRSGDFPTEGARQVFEEFNKAMSLDVRDERGVVSFLRKSLAEARGEDKGEKLLERLGKKEERSVPLAPVSRFSPQQLGEILKGEHPQVGALLLSSMGSETALGLLQDLSEDHRLELFRRMAILDRPPSAVATEILVEMSDQEEAGSIRTGNFQESRVQRLRNLAEILVVQGESMDKKVLAAVAEMDEDLSQEISELMFTFDDIVLVDKKSMQKLLMGVEGKDLALALRAAGNKVKKHILDNVSSRVRDQIVEEQEMMGSVPISEVLEAQRRIADCARQMIESGEVTVQRG